MTCNLSVNFFLLWPDCWGFIFWCNSYYIVLCTSLLLSLLLLHYILLIVFGFFWCLYNSRTRTKVNNVIFIHNWLVAFGTRFSSRLALLKVRIVRLYRHIQLTIFTKFRLLITLLLMRSKLSTRILSLTILTLIFSMKLLLMLILEINIVHLFTNLTFLYVPSAIPKMSCHLRFRKIL